MRIADTARSPDAITFLAHSMASTASPDIMPTSASTVSSLTEFLAGISLSKRTGNGVRRFQAAPLGLPRASR